jgi:type I restriction enzyme, S subunit
VTAQVSLLELPRLLTDVASESPIAEFEISDFVKNFGLLVDAADGAKQLRVLVLALALQGRLSSREASDGDARESLKAALSDRCWRVEERQSKPKLDPKIEALADKTPVPDQWVECRLDDCAQLINGRAYAQPELLAAGTPVIRIQNLNGGMDWYYSDLVLPERQYCDHGDLLFAWSASFGPYIWSGSKAIYHYHIWKLNLSPAVNKRFLYFTLLHITDVVREQSHGLAMLHMTKGQMERWPLLLPPLPEQKRIVARVDQLMALIDDLEAKQTKKRDLSTRFTNASLEALTTAESPEDFDAAWQRVVENFPIAIDRAEKVAELRRTLLDLGLRARLTRATASAEPATQLLGRLRAERVAARGVVSKCETVQTKPFVLPASWAWARLDELWRSVTDGDHQPPPKSESGVAFLTIGNMSAGGLNFSESRFVSEDYFRSLDELRVPARGDLLYTVVGSYGIPVPVETERPFCVQRHIAILKPLPSTNVAFLRYAMQSDFVYRQAQAGVTGIAQPTVGLGVLRAFLIPVPPAEEQSRIVAKIEHLMKLCDDLEAKLRRAEDRASKLVEAVVQEMVA